MDQGSKAGNCVICGKFGPSDASDKCITCNRVTCRLCQETSKFVQNLKAECVFCDLMSLNPTAITVCALSDLGVQRAQYKQKGKFQLNITFSNVQKYAKELERIEIRCVKIDSRGYVILGEQTWPDSYRLFFNGESKMIQDGQPLKQNSSLRKRKDKPFSLSFESFQKMLDKSQIPDQKHYFMIEFDNHFDDKNSMIADSNKVYYAALVVGIKSLEFEDFVTSPMVRTFTEDECLQFIKTLFLGKGQQNKGELQSNEEANFEIMANANLTPSFKGGKSSKTEAMEIERDEIQVEGLKLDLLCKLTLTKLIYPGRGNKCKHLSCFSLKNFFTSVKVSEHKKVYCPICSVTIQYFIYDKLVEKIIKNSSNDESFYFNNFGDFQRIYEQNAQSKIGMDIEEKIVLSINDDDEGMICEPVNCDTIQPFMSNANDPSLSLEKDLLVLLNDKLEDFLKSFVYMCKVDYVREHVGDRAFPCESYFDI